MSLLLQLAGYGVVGYLLLAALMFFMQDRLLFFPTAATHESNIYPESSVHLYSTSTDSTTLKGWLVNPEYMRDRLIIYYGGNAEDIYYNIEEFIDIQAASLFVPYRGYGPNTGRPGEESLYSDALAVIDDVMRRFEPGKIFLMGRSLGSGVACHVAARRPVDGVILVTPYDSIENVAAQLYPWLPVRLLIRHRFNSISSIGQIESTILVLYGGQDNVVKPERTRALIEKITSLSREVLIEAADHGTISMYPEYWRHVLEFIHSD